ncbi:MAG: hypothetical protein JXB45_12230 [Candidatus Krumholzibacteriota bacterium]|nr:hypothetical protein [Candidatus Krumholzibacteriota bacterium]
MEPVILDKFSVKIAANEVIRYLENGKRASSGQIKRFQGVLDLSLDRAGVLVRPRGIYVIAPGKSLPGSSLFRELERMAFCVCTIGPALEKEVKRLMDRDQLLEAVILDAAGSVAAEAVASHIDGIFKEQAAAEGLKTSCRASPGYGDWDVGEQKSLFALLPAGRIGVELSPSCMMIPRKSISFAVHIDRNPVRLRSENSCENCDLDICPFRITDR